MTLYTQNGSYPKPIPERIRLPDGSTRTDSSTYTVDEIASAGFIVAPDKPAITDMQRVYWDGVEWVVKNIPMSEIRAKMMVSMRQARLALLQQNLLTSVEAAIAAMTEPDKSQVEIEWSYANTVERLSPWIGSMGVALGLTDEQMDNLFILAKEL